MKRGISVLLLTLACFSDSAAAGSFEFGSNANGISGASNATLSSAGFDLMLLAGPVGGVFNESDSGGLGVNTSAIPGVTDGGSVGQPDKLNIIDGASPVSGSGEFVTFSFSQSGVLQTLLFDGLKDETLEFFTVEFPDASVVTFFDSQTELRLVNQGFQLSDLGVPNPTLAPTEDDDFENVDYTFAAGEQFKVTYGEIDFGNVLPGYVPATGGSGNGARFEGILVRPVPEPSTLAVAAVTLIFTVAARVKRR